MWEKIKQWWTERKERRAEKKLKNALNLKIAINQILHNGPDWVPYNIHHVPTLICSVYFESDKDITAVDFSQEEQGLVHYMLFTPKKITEYKNGENDNPNKKEVHTVIQNGIVFMKYYADGSEGWCFNL